MPRPTNHFRLAIILSHPKKEYAPWLRWLRAHTALVFRVFFLEESRLASSLDSAAGSTGHLAGGYDWEVVENTRRRPDPDRFFGLRNPALRTRIADWGADAVLLCGPLLATHLKLVAWARMKGVPLLFHSAAHGLGRRPPGWLRKISLTALYRRFDAVLFAGEASRDYFRGFGISDGKLFHMPVAADAALFDVSSSTHRAISVALRVELGLSAETRVVLFVGDLTPQHQPLALLETFLALNPPDTALVFVGEGPEKPEMLALAARAPDTANLQFLPPAAPDEMPARYLLADLLVLPFRGVGESWGLAVSEAMLLGLPCLVSDHVGCQRDLVTDGETGWVFAAEDPASLRVKLATALASLATNRTPLRAAALERVARFGCAESTSGLLRALAHAAPSLRENTAPPR